MAGARVCSHVEGAIACPSVDWIIGSGRIDGGEAREEQETKKGVRGGAATPTKKKKG